MGIVLINGRFLKRRVFKHSNYYGSTSMPVVCKSKPEWPSFLPRDASAERGDATVNRPSVRPSVCPSVRNV